jgi:hypothetical protein
MIIALYKTYFRPARNIKSFGEWAGKKEDEWEPRLPEIPLLAASR